MIYSISATDVLLRLGLALLAGMVVGYERESHGRAAGLRTTMLGCVASALAMLISEYLFITSSSVNAVWRPDPARLAAGILTGMGFLGAGSIVRHDNVIRGVTTAAVLWFVTVLGLAFGSGCYVLGLVGMTIALITLFVLPWVEEYYIKNDWYGTVTLVVEMDRIADQEIRNQIERMGIKVKKMDLEYDLSLKQKNIRCEIKYKKGKIFELSQKVMQDLLKCPGVLKIKWI